MQAKTEREARCRRSKAKDSFQICLVVKVSCPKLSSGTKFSRVVQLTKFGRVSALKRGKEENKKGQFRAFL